MMWLLHLQNMAHTPSPPRTLPGPVSALVSLAGRADDMEAESFELASTFRPLVLYAMLPMGCAPGWPCRCTLDHALHSRVA